MKKLLMIFCLVIGLFLFIPNSYAINYYDSVNFKTAFAEEINLEEITKIEIAYADQTEYTKYLMLTKENNFESTLTDVPIGNILVEYGIVNNDVIGYYNVTAEVYDNYDNTIDIVVNVTLQNNIKNEDLIDGLKKEIVPSSNYTGQTTTNKVDADNQESEEIDISNSSTTTTTTKKIVEEDEEAAQKKAEEKALNRKKSNIIGIVMFSIIGIVIFVGAIYASIKISKANK